MLRDTRDMIKRKVIFQIRKWKGKNYYYRCVAMFYIFFHIIAFSIRAFIYQVPS